MPDGARFSILIVEDDPDARSNMVDILECDGYDISTAGTVAEALDRSNWPDYFAIVLDRKLPDGSAQELLPRLRELAPEAAVVIVTGFSDLEGAITALREGAADYILKPIDVESLRARLARIADHWRVKEALKLAQQRILQSERLAAIGQMVTGLAHESRNALQRSQACLEMLALAVKDRPACLDLIARIQKAQDHLHHLYEEVRTFAAPIRVKRESCDLSQIIMETWEHLALARQNRDARLCLEDSPADLHCLADHLAMEQVFRNILDNSLSACSDPVQIAVHWSECRLADQPALRISIADNGPGLTAEQRQRIFEPFFTTKTRGTGLGMPIVKRIVEAHGGTIAVGTEDGPGAEIVIILPRDNI